MLYFLKRSLIVFLLVIILHIQICYADNNFDIRVIDFNNNFGEATDNFYNSNDYVYQDIKGCSLQNHLINRKVSKFKNILIFFKFFFSLAWFGCGILGFFCLLWAFNRMYTGGAVDHD